tara:strand:+ start:455 stop:976 length:522 start_codon:yes stop_codon:yes gene_type:complete
MNKVIDLIDKSHADCIFTHCNYIAERLPRHEKLNNHNVYVDSIGEAILNYLLPKIEKEYGKKLCPTYSFWRKYYEGQPLLAHTDRPSCEVSVTLNIGGEGGTDWSIFVDNTEFSMEVGQGVIYKGCEQKHWREPLTYKSHVQMFLHYIEVDGQHYPEFKYDKRPGLYFKRKPQ